MTSHNLTGDVVNQIVQDYGEGKYTFYMFVKNAGSSYSQSYVGQNRNIDIGENIGQMITGNMDGSSVFTSDNLYFDALYKKNLFYVNTINNVYKNEYSRYSSSGSNDSNGACDRIVRNYNDDSGLNNNYRPLMLMFEKVSNFKVVEDIPFPELTEKENEKNSYTGDFSWEDDIDSAISTIYDHSKNMILANGVYKINSETFKSENFTLNEQTDINLSIENPFIYVIQNCDFRYVDSLFFQIRVGNDYIRQAINIVTDFNSTNVPQYLAYLSGRDSNNNPVYSYFASQSALFGNKQGEYFIQNADVTDQDGKGDKRNGLKLKDNYARGVYDLMLVPTGSRTPGKPIDCNLYIYRHRVDFIKIMKAAPGTTRIINGQDVGAEFINHYDDKQVLWQSSFYIGDTFSSTSSNDSDVSVLDALKKYATSSDKENFALKDSVTREAIAYYRNGTLYGPNGNSTAGEEVELFTILKNYVLYVE